MDKIILDFEQAKTKHLLFKSKLRSILYGAKVDEAPVLSHFECTVGQWIYNRALKEYGHHPEMQKLEKTHADIHTSARHLISLYKDGKVEEARLGLVDMEQIADDLVELLSVLEYKLGSDRDVNKSIPEYQPMEVSVRELQDLAIANGKLDKIIKEQSGELLKERKVLHDLFTQAPVGFCIMRGKEHVFEIANPVYIQLIGGRDPIGKTVREALPELAGQGFYELLDNVFNTGETFVGKEMLASVYRGDKLEHLYLNFSYQAFVDTSGNIDGVLVCVYEVTEQVNARKLIEKNEGKLKEMIHQLKHANEDLEIKVKFRNLELEKENLELKTKLGMQ